MTFEYFNMMWPLKTYDTLNIKPKRLYCLHGLKLVTNTKMYEIDLETDLRHRKNTLLYTVLVHLVLLRFCQLSMYQRSNYSTLIKVNFSLGTYNYVNTRLQNINAWYCQSVFFMSTHTYGLIHKLFRETVPLKWHTNPQWTEMREIICLVNSGENLQASNCYIVEIKLTIFIYINFRRGYFKKLKYVDGP
jgi:hypothetical protein